MVPPPCVCWSLNEVVDRVVGLAVAGPLPIRTVVVPRLRLAQQIRVCLLERGRGDLLVGTHFTTPHSLAWGVLQRTSGAFSGAEDELRLPRLRVLYGRGLDPAAYSRERVRSTPGWEEALARTVTDLERGGIAADDVERLGTASGRGLAEIQRQLERAAGPSLTRAGSLVRAAAILVRQPTLAARWGAVLVVADVHADVVEARFLDAIPGAQRVFRGVRPRSEDYLARAESLYGPAARQALAAAPVARPGRRDLDILADWLFTDPEAQSRPERPRAAPVADGSVVLEEYAGVAAEVEAAAAWVARQVLERRLPLSQIAVLVPQLDPLAQLLHDRLQQLPWPGRLPVHVSGGLPGSASPDGQRALAVVQALQDHLSLEAMALVLPGLRPAPDQEPLPHSAAAELLSALGTTGGSSAHPEGALTWPDRAAARRQSLAAGLGLAQGAEGDEEQVGLARERTSHERLLRYLLSVEPVLVELAKLAEAVLADQPLEVLWQRLAAFLRQRVVDPGASPVLDLAAVAIERAANDPDCRQLSGYQALALVGRHLQQVRLATGRFGQAAVYVGTLSGAAGLSFAAVRVIGLAEGVLPASPREDTVLPDAVRQQLTPHQLPVTSLRALQSLHEFTHIVRDTTEELALSAPRLTLERTYREPAALFLEVIAALGRNPDGLVSLARLRVQEFVPGRQRAQRWQRSFPLGESWWHDRVAVDRLHRRTAQVPLAWLSPGVLRVTDLVGPAATALQAVMDGVLGPQAELGELPGLTPRRPLTASTWRLLLACPHRFLLEHLLGWREPPAASSQRELPALAYGSLVHRVLQRFFTTHGQVFAAHGQTLDYWQQQAMALATAEFVQMLEQQPLVGEIVRAQQRRRLERDLRGLLACLWHLGPSRCVASEEAFGFRPPVSLEVAGTSVWVRGFFDLVEAQGTVTRVWDVKTGQCRARVGREAAPSPVIDAQLALYGLVAQGQTRVWRTPPRVEAGYMYCRDQHGRLRRFSDDFDALAQAARQWLQVTVALWAERSFPHTPRRDDCRICPFAPLCGRQTQGGSAARPGAHGALGAYAELRP